VSEEPHVPPAEAIDDPSIPLLTDRIFLPAVELDTALPTMPAPGAPAAPTARAAAEGMGIGTKAQGAHRALPGRAIGRGAPPASRVRE